MIWALQTLRFLNNCLLANKTLTLHITSPVSPPFVHSSSSPESAPCLLSIRCAVSSLVMLFENVHLTELHYLPRLKCMIIFNLLYILYLVPPPGHYECQTLHFLHSGEFVYNHLWWKYLETMMWQHPYTEDRKSLGTSRRADTAPNNMTGEHHDSIEVSRYHCVMEAL